MLGYYAAQARIRYYGPTGEGVRVEAGHVYATVGHPFAGTPTWKHPPHEYLANLDLEEWQADRIAQFTGRFGPLAPRHHPSLKPTRSMDTSTDLERFEPGDPIWVDTAQFVALQRFLRGAWRGDRQALGELTTGLTGDLELEPHPNGLELAVRDLWTLIRILFLCDYASRKVKTCANSDCSTPWFLESRKGQKYCSHACAVLINVRRFRERDAMRRAGKSKGKIARR